MSADLVHSIKAQNGLSPATLTDTAGVGAIIDTQGFESLTFLILSGTVTDGTSYTPKLDEGDASNLSDAAEVAAAGLVGTIAGATFAATDDNKVKKLGYRCGPKRYVRLTLTPAGATSGGAFSAIAVLGHGGTQAQ